MDETSDFTEEAKSLENTNSKIQSETEKSDFLLEQSLIAKEHSLNSENFNKVNSSLKKDNFKEFAGKTR